LQELWMNYSEFFSLSCAWASSSPRIAFSLLGCWVLSNPAIALCQRKV